MALQLEYMETVCPWGELGTKAPTPPAVKTNGPQPVTTEAKAEEEDAAPRRVFQEASGDNDHQEDDC